MTLLNFRFSSLFRRLPLIRGILCILVFLCILYYILYIKTSSNTSIWNLIFGTNGLRIILLWTAFFSEGGEWIPSTRSLNCQMDCQITSNRELLLESAAVIFHLRSIDLYDLPSWNKHGNQKWILFNLEAPPNTPSKELEVLEGKIHWTATYRRDSDFYAPYGVLVPTNATHISPELNGEGNKSSCLVCWIVSHCYTSSQRESYVEDLAKYIPITIYGYCGNETCPNSSKTHCYHHISPNCKFYLSFENSICLDYATEKLFYALETDMVPIVMGGDNYSLTLPTHSYINAMDFPNPKALATFLLELNNDTERYKKYHMWKTDYKVVDLGHKWVCDLCQRLHNDSYTSASTYKNLWSWWFNPKCHNWTEFISDH